MEQNSRPTTIEVESRDVSADAVLLSGGKKASVYRYAQESAADGDHRQDDHRDDSVRERQEHRSLGPFPPPSRVTPSRGDAVRRERDDGGAGGREAPPPLPTIPALPAPTTTVRAPSAPQRFFPTPPAPPATVPARTGERIASMPSHRPERRPSTAALHVAVPGVPPPPPPPPPSTAHVKQRQDGHRNDNGKIVQQKQLGVPPTLIPSTRNQAVRGSRAHDVTGREAPPLGHAKATTPRPPLPTITVLSSRVRAPPAQPTAVSAPPAPPATVRAPPPPPPRKGIAAGRGRLAGKPSGSPARKEGPSTEQYRRATATAPHGASAAVPPPPPPPPPRTARVQERHHGRDYDGNGNNNKRKDRRQPVLVPPPHVVPLRHRGVASLRGERNGSGAMQEAATKHNGPIVSSSATAAAASLATTTATSPAVFVPVLRGTTVAVATRPPAAAATAKREAAADSGNASKKTTEDAGSDDVARARDGGGVKGIRKFLLLVLFALTAGASALFYDRIPSDMVHKYTHLLHGGVGATTSFFSRIPTATVLPESLRHLTEHFDHLPKYLDHLPEYLHRLPEYLHRLPDYLNHPQGDACPYYFFCPQETKQQQQQQQQQQHQRRRQEKEEQAPGTEGMCENPPSPGGGDEGSGNSKCANDQSVDEMAALKGLLTAENEVPHPFSGDEDAERRRNALKGLLLQAREGKLEMTPSEEGNKEDNRENEPKEPSLVTAQGSRGDDGDAPDRELHHAEPEGQPTPSPTAHQAERAALQGLVLAEELQPVSNAHVDEHEMKRTAMKRLLETVADKKS